MKPQVSWEVVQSEPLLSDALYDELAAFLALAEPGSANTAEELRQFDEQRPAGQHHALTLCRVNGSLIGVAETLVPRSHDKPGWYFLNLSLHPKQQSGHLPEKLFGRAESQLPSDRHVLLSGLTEGDWQEPILKARGFTELERMWNSTLDLQAFEPSKFQHHTERARAAGLSVLPFSEVADLNDEMQQRRLYQLMIDLLSDVPSGEPITPWPFETWLERILATADFDPSGFFVLLSPAGEWIGVCELYKPDPAKPGTLHQGLTGVKREWRGLGGAWLLKLTAAAWAKAKGWAAANTSNHTGNAAMLAINEEMGFVRERAWVKLQKTFS